MEWQRNMNWKYEVTSELNMLFNFAMYDSLLTDISMYYTMEWGPR